MKVHKKYIGDFRVSNGFSAHFPESCYIRNISTAHIPRRWRQFARGHLLKAIDER